MKIQTILDRQAVRNLGRAKKKLTSIAGLAIMAIATITTNPAQAADVDLSTWTAESYSSESFVDPSEWVLEPGNLNVSQVNNGEATFFISDFDAFGSVVQGKIEVLPTGDDDYIGFALGILPGDPINTNANYLLVDWKGGNQTFDFPAPSCTPGHTAAAGLAVSRVTGIPTSDEIWGHTDDNASCSPSGQGLTELQRALTLGNTAWVSNREYTFSFEFTASSLKVFVDGVLEIDLNGAFNNGRLAFYNFSQDVVRYSGFTTTPLATADAGPDQTVNEFQGVTLDGSGSLPVGGTLSWVQVGGPNVTLLGADTSQPSFTAPAVAPGGATLTFELTFTNGGEINTDQVSITVVNINHTPVADAGIDKSIAEGSPVILNGSDSFDIDDDPITYQWVQTSGPLVTITGADTAYPSFSAPSGGDGGAPGVVATLGFTLTVDDGFPADAPASGFGFEDVVDAVTVEITNVNNDPIANAGPDQTINENGNVLLNASASSDPDSDALTYAWTQVGGASVALIDGATASPSFTAPFVMSGGEDLTFQLMVDDGFGGTATSQVVVHVQNANDPPLVSAAQPTVDCLWPPNHKLVAVGITGVSDPDDNAVFTIDSVTQDEATNGLGDGDTAVDAIINSDGTVSLRAERSGTGDGRVYHINFTASDFEGSASGTVDVCVPHNKKSVAIDGGELYDSTN